MNPMFSRILKALCTLAVVAMLSACGGASSTVESFKPKRVIGLGDGYNDVGSAVGAPFTVRGTNNISTVVEQVAYLFNLGGVGIFVDAGTYTALPASGVFSYAVGGSLISGGANSLQDQITAAAADVGGSFSDTDLIIISAGTWDLKNGTDVRSNYVALIESLVDTYKAKHILVMQPLEIATTPFGKAAASGTYSATAANDFFDSVKATLQNSISHKGLNYNPIIFGASGLSSYFNIYSATNPVSLGPFVTSGSVPYCGNAQVFTGCLPNTGDTTVYDTTLFADGINLTPAGNRWVAGYLYLATGQGWR